MSEPVIDTEIEDVLSSIRRLVSEETGVQPRPEPVRKPLHEERLVLTPALRVSEVVAVVPQETVVSQDSADVSIEPEKLHLADPETPWSDPDTTLYEAAEILGDESGGDQDDPDASDLDALLEELQTVDPDSEADDQSADYGDDTQDVAAVPAEQQPAEMGRAQDQPDSAEPDPKQDDDHIDHSPKAAAHDDLSPLSAKIAALETAIGETQDQWEPDGQAGDDYAGTTVQTLAWMDHDDAEEPEQHIHIADTPTATDDTGPDPQTSGAGVTLERDFSDDADLDFLGSEDTVMDEESLRELVADIVRQELQGALGERITRNVRKLVRREIHRALTTQELD